jgi:hypothetical protein
MQTKRPVWKSSTYRKLLCMSKPSTPLCRVWSSLIRVLRRAGLFNEPDSLPADLMIFPRIRMSANANWELHPVHQETPWASLWTLRGRRYRRLTCVVDNEGADGLCLFWVQLEAANGVMLMLFAGKTRRGHAHAQHIAAAITVLLGCVPTDASHN